jgi:hypothetical protein
MQCVRTVSYEGHKHRREARAARIGSDDLNAERAAGAEGEDGADAVVGVGEEEDARLVVRALGADVEGEDGGADTAEVSPASFGPVSVDFGVADAAAQADAAGAVQHSWIGDSAQNQDSVQGEQKGSAEETDGWVR